MDTGMKQYKYCVTGAGGYLGSWLVKILIDRGYSVHATLRDPENPKKAGPLKSLEGSEARLRLFKADLLEDNSFDKAVEGCHGVYHVASPVEFFGNSEEELMVPAVKGTLNVLKSCIQSKTVKRVVVTSSVVAVFPLSDEGEFITSCIDESIWTPIEYLKKCQEASQFYFISKVVAEQEALKFAEEHKNDIEVATILPSVVAGPFMTSELPTTCKLLLGFFTGDEKQLDVLKVFRRTIGSIPCVHVEDICNAHIFVMEHPTAKGRHICSSVPVSLWQLSDYLAQSFPELPLKLQVKEEEDNGQIVGISSQKLIDMGFEFKHGLHQIVADCISAAVAHGDLQLPQLSHRDFTDGPNEESTSL